MEINFKDITLLIPANNEKESIKFVLQELSDKNILTEVLIVVDNENDNTLEEIKSYNVKSIISNKKGYGNALIRGISACQTQFVCIYNADGSFDPLTLLQMKTIMEEENHDFIYGSRYLKQGKSDDDTILTYIGNFFFTKIVKFLFKINLTDILFTFIFFKRDKVKDLKLKAQDFRFCVELPILMKENNLRYSEIPSHERRRFSGKKKVNEFKDGALILCYILKKFFYGK